MMFIIVSLIICVVTLPSCYSFHAPATSITRNNVNSLSMISHGVKLNRLSRPADQRKALIRSLTTEVMRHGRIRTTTVRAKALRKHVDHIITLAKKGTQHHRRQALAILYDKDLVASLFEQVPERYGDRQGGYCRVIREDVPRRGDNAQMAIIELV
mmetsp:Transcript_17899/g.17967  ORF Transcript_17899/g.17967 Transcript_17899/m.17967 type:complete len:156 (+) Transcript_17899:75-542(+)|eukprot:CAMPEP_0182427500 /NCGR_PEP_ID=MMETSP1167-20130531/17918_1 /TAXON_ID=2988 /ORGANISM="Mallomonas Sp, Strain CCMP3275" /LENGTH=155 /DNA_ID=CAMNT_0024609787 /DNA_START=69 /DNA_END=536 /DNA_ORIENTATION=+